MTYYFLKFYSGNDPNNIIYLGALELADDYTYQHYLNSINRIQFTCHFERDDIYRYGMFRYVLGSSVVQQTQNEWDGDTTLILHLYSRPEHVSLLTEEELLNSQRTQELMQKLSATKFNDILN